MAHLDELAVLLAASTVAGPPGSSALTASGYLLIKGMMPDSTATSVQHKVVALIETAGFQMLERVDMEQPGLQVIVRGDPLNSTSTDVYSNTRAKAAQLRDVLSGYTGSSGTSSVHYTGIWCENLAFFGYDDRWRPEFVSNFRIMKATT